MFALSLHTACTGPQLHIKNPDQHTVFVDGLRTTADTLAFRYYGTTRWDILPRVREDNGVPYFDHSQSSATIEIPTPGSSWLFPLDLPLESIDRLLHGRRDQTITITAPLKPPEMRINLEIPQQELGKLSARGKKARIQR